MAVLLPAPVLPWHAGPERVSHLPEELQWPVAGLSQAEPGRHTQEKEDHMIPAQKETLASSKTLCLSLGHMAKFL